MPTPTAVALKIGREVIWIESFPHARIHPITQRPPNPKTPYSFQGLLRAHLRGRLQEVRHVEGERIIEWVFPGHVLHCRLFGRGGGIYLLQGDRVLGASHGPVSDTLPPLVEGGGNDEPPRFAPASGETWGEAAEAYFTERAVRFDAAQRILHVRRWLKQQLKRRMRLVKALSRDLDAAEGAELLQAKADALAMVVHSIPRGTSKVRVVDPMDPEVTYELKLDPARRPADTMQRMYKKASRLRAAVDDITDRLLDAEQAAEELREALTRLEADPGSVADVARDVGAPPPAPLRRPKERERVPWQTWVGPSGEILWAGTNGAANHALLVRRAKGKDYWFHLRERPGTHVVLPMRGGQPPSPDELKHAAQLVLKLGHIPEGGPVEIQYTQVRHVKPIKGAAPGRVIVEREKVLYVERDPDMLRGWQRKLD